MSRYTLAQILKKTTKAVVSNFDILELQENVLEVVQDIFDADACSLFWVEEEPLLLRMTAGRGYSSLFIGRTARLVPPNQIVEHPSIESQKLGITGWIASACQPVKADSATELRAHPHWLGVYDPEQFGTDKHVENFYGIPLQTAPGKVVGVLKVEGKREDNAFKPFTAEDEHICEILGAHIAIAISNARQVSIINRQNELLARHNADLETINNSLYKLVDALSQDLPMQYLLDEIISTTANVLHAEACVLFLKDEDPTFLIEQAGAGYVQHLIGRARYHLVPRELLIEHPVHPGDRVGLTAWIAITGVPFLARNNDELKSHPHWRGQYDSEHYPEGSGKRCQSFLGLPLKVGEEVLGVLKVENKKVDGQYVPFTEEDRRLFEILAHFIAIPIGAVRDQRLKLERRITDAMYRVSQALVGRFELAPLLEEIVKTGLEIFSAEACVVFLVDEENKKRLVETKGQGYFRHLEGKAEYQLIPRADLIDDPKNFDEKVGLTAWIAITGQPFLARSNDELRKHPHWKGTFDQDHYPAGSGRRCESFLGLPLKVGEEVLGVLKVENKNIGGQYVPFDDRDKQIFQFLVNGAAIAIRNARDLQRIQETQRMEAVGRSADRMAHRINTPLQNILFAARSLEEDLKRRHITTKTNRKDIRIIVNKVREMADGIGRLHVAVGPIGSPSERCDIRTVLRSSSIEDLSFSKQFKSREIQVRLKGLRQLSSPFISGDKGLLQEAFSNLVNNALDAVSDGGRISIQVSESDNSLVIHISDDGPGIPESIRAKLFEPLASSKKGGWGLGLALVRRNIEAHGGSISLVETESRGATFRIELPRYVVKEEQNGKV